MVFFNQKHSTFASIHAELKTTQLGMPKPAPLSHPLGSRGYPLTPHSSCSRPVYLPPFG